MLASSIRTNNVLGIFASPALFLEPVAGAEWAEKYSHDAVIINEMHGGGRFFFGTAVDWFRLARPAQNAVSKTQWLPEKVVI
jgi:hypothetical protein